MNDSEKYCESTCQDILHENRGKVNEYLNSLKLENKAETTITMYKFILEGFFMKCSVPVEDLTSDDVLSWLTDFSIGKSEGTINFYLSVLSTFFAFCLHEEYMNTMVTKKRWRPKIPYALPKFLDEYEYSRVIVYLEQVGIRDRALILFLFTTGCRVSEVSNLAIQDVDFEKRTANVIGKGNKSRRSYFSEECALALTRYLETRSCDPEEPLFKNKSGKRLLASGIREVVKKVGQKAGLKQSLHPHCCRHTFATNMLARGADLQFIADVLGHSNLNTTRIYAQIPTEDMLLKYQNIMG